MNKFWLGLGACALLATGCAKEEVAIKKQEAKGGDSEITVRLRGLSSTRSLLGDSDATTIKNYEDNVVEFVLYVFDDAGKFIEKKESEGAPAQVILTGYTPEAEVQFVAFANTKSAGIALPDLAVGDDVAGVFDEIYVTLQSQLVSDFADRSKGFVMSGQYGASLTTGNLAAPADALYEIPASSDIVTVPVERVVAKIMLGDITFGPDITVGDILNFQIKGSGVQQAISHSFMIPGEITTIPASIPSGSISYYGSFAEGGTTVLAGLNDVDEDGLLDLSGLLTSVVSAAIDALGILGAPLKLIPVEEIVNDLLSGTIELTDAVLGLLNVKIGDLELVNPGDLIETPGPFWYVLPNAATTLPTLMTLQGEYNGESYYYPIIVNDPDTSTADHDYIRRNTIYQINVEFLSLAGNKDPNDPEQDMSLIVKVTPVDWEGPIIQNAQW